MAKLNSKFIKDKVEFHIDSMVEEIASYREDNGDVTPSFIAQVDAIKDKLSDVLIQNLLLIQNLK